MANTADSQPALVETHENPENSDGPAARSQSIMECECTVFDKAHCGCSVSSEDSDDKRVADAIERILLAQNRLEQLRFNLEQVDRIGLSCRTVGGFVDSAVRHLENTLDLLAVRIFLVEGQPPAKVFERSAPYGGGIISGDLCPAVGESPMFLSEQDHDFMSLFFGEDTVNIGSAVIVLLAVDEVPFGVLCLGSGDPLRYSKVKSWILIKALADKTALAIMNAFDHETAALTEIFSDVEGVYGEHFFREYLLKEFNRSWRSHRAFALLALSVEAEGEILTPADLGRLLARNLRAADIVGIGETAEFWILLPETELMEAQEIAKRLAAITADVSIKIHAGLTEFSRTATAMPILLRRAREALDEALEYGIPLALKTDKPSSQM